MGPFPPIEDLAGDVRRGTRTAADLLEDVIARIDARDSELRAFITVDREGARRAASSVDTRVRSGEALPLAGVPIALKDNLCTRGLRTTCGSRFLEGFVPPYDASVVRRLREAGAIIVGKTNLDEFAMGSSTENSAFGPARNPWDTRRVPGGSSGGSAVAVAAGLVPVALGSDTGGSIRQPAAFCGTVGLKPTYGRVSRFGLIAFGSSLDQIGPLAQRSSDAAHVLRVIAGADPADATSAAVPVPPFTDGLDAPLVGLRIGLPREYMGEGIDPRLAQAVRLAANRLEAAGARVSEVSLPHTSYGIPAYYVVATSEASSNLARYDGIHFGRRADAKTLEETYTRSRTEGFGAEVKRRILLGTFCLSSGHYDAYYDRAMRARALIRGDFEAVFAEVDVLLCPPTPGLPFLLGEKTRDPVSMYLQDVLTVAANLAGIPGIVVPESVVAEGDVSLPVAVQVLGRPFEEGRLFAVAQALERTRAPFPLAPGLEGGAS